MLSFLALAAFGQVAPVSLTSSAGIVTALPPKGTNSLTFFVSVDCPIANRYAPEIKRISESAAKRKVAVYLVYAGEGVLAKEVEEHRKAYGYSMPGLLDPKFEWVKSVNATVTPEAVLIDKKGAIRYQGRIDDLYSSHGLARTRATKFYLRNAIDALLAGKKPDPAYTAPIGCLIPR